MRSINIWRVLAWCVVLLAMGLTVYRAKTQPIAHDEAPEYEWFLDGSIQHVLQYNPANHVLFTLLAKPIVWSLGVSEFILRAPSLFGTAIYLLASCLLCGKLFGERILLFLTTAMLCLNPQILDSMPAARGYILGLGCLMTAMYAVAVLVERGEFQSEDKAWQRGCVIASVGLAASVLGSFTNIVPAAGLVVTFSALAMGSFRDLLRIGEQRLRDFAKYFFVPGTGVGFCFLWPYLIQARLAPNRIHFEKATLAAQDLFTASFLNKWTDDVFEALGAVPASPGSWQERVTFLGAYVLLPALFLLVCIGVVLSLRGPGESKRPQRAQCQMFGGAAILSVLIIVLPHFAVSIDYPVSRYCLFLIPSFTVAGVLGAQQISARSPQWQLKAAGLLMASLVVFDYALSIQVKDFRYNAYDVISLKLYRAIAEDAQRQGLKSVHVGGTWWYEPETNFYRRKFNAGWMAEYNVVDKSYFWRSPNALSPAEYDYFVYIPASDPELTGVRTVFRDELRQLTVVAKVRR